MRQTEHTDTEHTDEDRTLPRPELNPLLNPLLGQHMGRWAEVYFTAAPEDREAAVIALLEKLKGESTSAPTDAKAPTITEKTARRPLEFVSLDSAKAPLVKTPPKVSPLHAIARKSVICESCGQAAPETQRFCGLCGARMPGEAAGIEFERPAVVATGSSDQGKNAVDEYSPVEAAHLREAVFSFGGNVKDGASDEPAPYRYRIYVGAALAALILALLVMAHRGTQAWSGSSHPLPQAAPSAATPPAAQSAPKPERTAAAPMGDESHTRANANADNRKAEPKAEPLRDSAASPAPAPVSQPDRPSPSVPHNSPALAKHGNGSEELQIAEQFLNGAQGKARDSNEAARWLWQAVSKQNGAATLLLSDLYVRGDGVPKNCDQARLLLDAAARKGTAGAGQRLRNLQAFGCL